MKLQASVNLTIDIQQIKIIKYLSVIKSSFSFLSSWPNNI